MVLLSLERFLRMELEEAERRQLSNQEIEDSLYIKYGIKDGFLRKHALDTFMVSGTHGGVSSFAGLAMNEMEAKEAWDRLLETNALKQGNCIILPFP